GSWLLAGSMPVDEMAARFGLVLPPKRSYATVAGFVLSHLQHIPKTGEVIETDNWRFEVIDLDGNRIDKVLASRMEMDA
ncbi:MAG: DNA-binding protein, partial [Rhizobiales bacterium]|nr:DNA-binding protein [Hyphomicrobiales bacterium]